MCQGRLPGTGNLEGTGQHEAIVQSCADQVNASTLVKMAAKAFGCSGPGQDKMLVCSENHGESSMPKP